MCPVCNKRHKAGERRFGALARRCSKRWNSLSRAEQEILLDLTGAKVRLTAPKEMAA